MDKTLIFPLVAYLVAPTALISLVSYVLQAYFRRDYLTGKRVARKFIADPFVIKKEVVSSPENMKAFQEDIFEHALHINRDYFNSEINKYEQKIKELGSQVVGLQEQRTQIVSRIGEQGKSTSGTNSRSSEEELQARIKRINTDIDLLKVQLAEVKNKQISRASDNIEKRVMRTGHLWSSALLKLKESFGRFSLTWFAFCLVVVDYFIAVSLFKDLALDYKGQPWLYTVVAFIVPLVITLLEIFFVHQIFKNFKEKNYSNISTAVFIFLSAIFASIILLLRISVELSNDSGLIGYLQEVLFWLFFVGIIVAVGYKSTSHKNIMPVEEVLEAPFALIMYVCAVTLIAPLWLLEYIFGSKQNTPEVKRVIELEKRIKELEAEKIAEENSHNNSRNAELSFQKNKSNQHNLKNENQRKLEIKGVDKLIAVCETKLKLLESKKRSWEKRLKNLRLGAHSGVIIGLQKHTVYQKVR